MGLTAYQLNQRPYGDQAAPSRAKSAHELNELNYGTAPFAAGMTAADFAAQHAAHGEVFRYWEATTLPDATENSNQDGNLFVEVELGGNGHGRFYSTKRAVMDERFGLIPQGSTMFSCLPSVVEFTQGARLLRVAQTWRKGATIRRGDSDVDPLPQRFVAAIEKVTLSDGTVADPAAYEAVSADSPNDNDLGGIRWLADAPAQGTVYTVKFRYHPLYSCLGELIQGEPIGADGERLPQRVLLKGERE